MRLGLVTSAARGPAARLKVESTPRNADGRLSISSIAIQARRDHRSDSVNDERQ